jgi:2-methylcitrate dehydratase
MVYILSTMVRKAFEDKTFHAKLSEITNLDEVWKSLFLSPFDYGHEALYNENTRVNILHLTFRN